MSRRTPVFLAKGMLVAFAISFASLWVFVGYWDAEEAPWVLGTIAYFWVVSPLAVTTLLVSISRTKRWEWIMTGFEGAMILFTVAAWHTNLVVYPDPMSAITLIIFLPFAQYLAIAIFLLLVSLIGWRAKESWLKD